MAKNCLKTALIGSVSNGSLPLVGYLKIHVNVPAGTSATDPNSKFTISSNVYINITLSDDTKNLYNPTNGEVISQPYRQTGSISFALKDAGDYYVIISDLQYIRGILALPTFLATPINLAELQYSDIRAIGSTGNVKGFTGSLAALSGKTSLSTVMLGSAGSPYVYGDIAEACGYLTSLTGFSFAGTKVSGSIESFVQQQVKHSRTNATITQIPYLGGAKYLTFNGSAIPNQSSNTLSWADNSGDNTKTDITLNGTTVTVNKI